MAMHVWSSSKGIALLKVILDFYYKDVFSKMSPGHRMLLNLHRLRNDVGVCVSITGLYLYIYSTDEIALQTEEQVFKFHSVYFLYFLSWDCRWPEVRLPHHMLQYWEPRLAQSSCNLMKKFCYKSSQNRNWVFWEICSSIFCIYGGTVEWWVALSLHTPWVQGLHISNFVVPSEHFQLGEWLFLTYP